MPQFSVVKLLTIDSDVIVLSTKNIEGLNTAKIKNRGCSQKIERLVFFSPAKKTRPDFTLEVSDRFDAIQNGCYVGYVLRTFGKC